MSAPPNAGLWSSISRANMGNAVAAALGSVGQPQIQNAPPAAAAAPQVAPQQPQQQQPQPPQKPPITGPLDTPQKLQAYLNSCPPGSIDQLDFRGGRIASLQGVQFPPGVTELLLSDNQITTMAGVRFPPGLENLELQKNKITSLAGVQFPPGLTGLSLNDNQITSLSGVRFPPRLTDLVLGQNQITSLNGVQFPPGLTDLDLSQNKITSLSGVQFPIGLTSLVLAHNQIASLEGVQFPSVLESLDLGNNEIGSLYGFQFPPNSTIELKGNPLYSLMGIINPDEYLMDYLKHNFPSVYFRDFHYQRKDAKMAEKSALKAARQSQKATLKEMSDLSQQSMQNQLNTLTAFLREGMEARARQHAEQLAKEVEERRRPMFEVRLNGKLYPVPLNTEMTVQWVLDYLNDHYYVSVLDNCGVMHINFSGKQLDPGHTLADYNVQVEDTLALVCKFRPNPTQGGSKKRRPKKYKKHYKIRRNKSMKK